MSDYQDPNVQPSASRQTRRRRMDKYTDPTETPTQQQPDTGKSPASAPEAQPAPAQDVPAAVLGEADIPAPQPVSSPAYDNSNVGEQRRRSFQRPPQSTDVFTRMTQTGYQQTVRQQARPTYERPTATPGAQYTPPAQENGQPQLRPRLQSDAENTQQQSFQRTTQRPEHDEAFEKRMQQRSYQDDDNDYDEEEPRRHVGLTILLILLFLIVLLVGVYFLLPEGNTGVIGKLNQAKSAVTGVVDQVRGLISPTEAPAQVLDFKSSTTSGTTGCKCLFNLTTTQNASGVGLVDENGAEIVGTVTKTNSEGETNRLWEITVIFDEPYNGLVFAAIKQGEQWTTSDKSIALNFTLPTPTPSPTPSPTPAPEQEAPKDNSATPEGDNALTGANAVAAFGMNKTDSPDAKASVTAPSPTPTASPSPSPTVAPTATPSATPSPTPTASPTKAPTSTPTNTPTASPTASPVLTPSPTPGPTEMPNLTATGDASSLKMTDTIYIGAKAQSDYLRTASLNAVNPDRYGYWEGGVLTFRGDSFRRNAAYGTVEVSKDQMSVVWQKELGSLRTAENGTLYGVGWTGQPAIVKWSKEIRKMMNISDEKKDITALKEVIFSAMDGKVYFLDLTDGTQTRDPIDIGYPLKGSVSVDTSSRPMIAFGQGISKLSNGKQGKIGYYLYNLIDCTELMFINGRSSNTQKQYGSNGAFDGTGLFLWNSDAMVVAGENGLLYTVSLNTDLKLDPKSLTVNPSIVYLRSKANSAKNTQTSIESSIAMYGKYVFLADSYGALRCVDTDTMKTIWALDNGDNTDASIALDFDDNGTLWLYTGNTNFARLGAKKDVSIRRVNAMTGEIDWTYGIKCSVDKKTEQSGCKASPIIGEKSIDQLVIFTVNKVSEGGSTILALNKSTGEVAWQYHLDAEAISSPVAVYNDAGDAWIIQGDMNGKLNMLDGRSGAFLSSLDLGGQIQGSPAVYKDILVVGTSDKGNANMYGIKIE